MLDDERLVEGIPANYFEGQYRVDPQLLEHVTQTLSDGLRGGQPFADACGNAVFLLCPKITTAGLDNIPRAGQIIIVKNHPFHFDFTALSEIYRARPDLKILIKSSPQVDALPPDQFIKLHKDGPHADPRDMEIFKDDLKKGESIVATPWGSLDHMAGGYANMFRAAQSVRRYNEYAQAGIVGVVPVGIDVVWGNKDLLPLQSMTVTIGRMIENKDQRTILSGLNTKLPEMFTRYVGS